MKKFITRFLLFILIPVPFLLILSGVVDSGLKKSRNFYYAEWNDIFSGKVNADLIILGTSKAWVQFSPRILDSALNLNTYNLGLDGASFMSQQERFKIYLRTNKKPKYIIQEVGPSATFLNSNAPPANAQFYPYLQDSSIWRIYQNYLVPGGPLPTGFMMRYFPLYKYNNQLPLIKEGLLAYVGKGEKATKYKGYEGKLLPFVSSFDTLNKSSKNTAPCRIDSESVYAFRNFVKFCSDNDIKVFLVETPNYKALYPFLQKYDQFEKIVGDISKQYNVPFLNYSKDSLSYHRDYYYNFTHLNKTGSELFSREVARDIKPFIK